MTYDQISRDRSTNYAHETRDCTVRALAMTANLPYGAAHRELELAGRQPRHGMRMRGFLDTRAKIANYDVIRIPRDAQPKTLNQLTHDRRYKQGRYLVITRGHAQSYVDGELYDAAGWSGRARIVMMWEFRPR